MLFANSAESKFFSLSFWIIDSTLNNSGIDLRTYEIGMGRTLVPETHSFMSIEGGNGAPILVTYLFVIACSYLYY